MASTTIHASVSKARRSKAWDNLLSEVEVTTRGNFFNPDTMRFWGSKLVGQPITTPGNDSGRTWFVTSEQMYDMGSRGFTVRSWDPSTGHIDTIGELNEYETAFEAVEAQHAVAGRA